MRKGAVTLGDVNANGEQFLVVAWGPCQRTGRYSVARQIEQHGGRRASRSSRLARPIMLSCDESSAPDSRRCHAAYTGLPHRRSDKLLGPRRLDCSVPEQSPF